MSFLGSCLFIQRIINSLEIYVMIFNLWFAPINQNNKKHPFILGKSEYLMGVFLNILNDMRIQHQWEQEPHVSNSF